MGKKNGLAASILCEFYKRKFLIAFGAVVGVLGYATHYVNNSDYEGAGALNGIIGQGSDMVASAQSSIAARLRSLTNGFSKDEWHNKYDLVHVVETDFLQYQLDLVHMNQARLSLFETFTLPSMKQQTNKEYLWVIWTDPELGDSFKNQLIELVKPMPNVVVLGYRRDRKMDFRDMNGMPEEAVDGALVTGSRKLLIDYQKATEGRLLLETRLDADDGLNKDFIETIQYHAAGTVGKSDLQKDFRIFCAEHHTEWRYYKPDDPNAPEGHLVHYHNPSFCINTGLTVGYQTQAKSRHLQVRGNCDMNEWYEQCNDSSQDLIVHHETGSSNVQHMCISRDASLMMMRTQNRQLKQAVLMSRTPTAAGMKRVLGTEQTYKSTFESMQAQKEAWEMIDSSFGVKKDKVVNLRKAMEENIVNILEDALQGQCMPGHSCKASTKRKLVKLLERAKMMKKLPDGEED